MRNKTLKIRTDCPNENATHYYYYINGHKFSVVDIKKLMSDMPFPTETTKTTALFHFDYIEAMEISARGGLKEPIFRAPTMKQLLVKLDRYAKKK